jgi:hypothetical protein
MPVALRILIPRHGFLLMSYAPSPSAGAAPANSSKAVVSLVLGILSICTCVTGIPAAILGFMAIGEINRQPRMGGKGMAIAGIATGLGGMGISAIMILLALLLPAVQAARQAAQRAQSINNMKQLGLGMLMGEMTEKRLPGDILDRDGKPLLSWRVKILPYIEEQALYNQFRHNEPWDSPHNLALASRMPRIYLSPKAMPEPPGSPGKTLYLRPKGSEMIHGGVVKGEPMNQMSIAQIKDGTSNTILLVEASEDRAVVWTKPDDLEIDLANPRRGLGGLYYPKESFLAEFADGSVHFIGEKATDATLRKLFTRAGNEPVAGDDY